MAEHKLHLIISLFALRRYPYNYIFFVIDNVGASSEEITQSSRSRRLRPSCERDPRGGSARPLVTRSHCATSATQRAGTLHVVLTIAVYVSHNQPQIDSLDINNIFGYVIVSRLRAEADHHRRAPPKESSINNEHHVRSTSDGIKNENIP